ncbi:MAG: Crp/Fnr family transcriptional regulator [Burkholderiales bacterium]
MQVTRISPLLLANVPLLTPLTAAQREMLAAVTSCRAYKKGAVIADAGGQARSLFIVAAGSAQTVLCDREGNELILSILDQGDYFGELELLEGRCFSASLVARQSCEVLILGKREFSRCLEENAQLALTVLRGMARRLREADLRVGSLAMQGVDARLAKFLLGEAQWVDGTRVVTSRYSKRDIARMIGASRERVSRVMKDMQVRGLIEERGDSILLREQILSLA